MGTREKKTSTDYFLAGARLPWYAVGLSMVASSISTEQFMGEVGFAYSFGLAVANWEWLVFPALTLLLWVFVPLYVRHRIMTMPEFLERRYGPGSRTIFALLTVLSYAVVNLPLVLYSGGLVLNHIFGLPLWLCVLMIALLTGAYTVYGGLSSVVWTDVFQCVLLLLGGMAIFVVGLLKVEGGWSAIVGTGDRAHLILPMDHPTLPWPAMVGLAFCTAVWYYCTNQYINQRCLGARNEWHAKMGVVFCGFLGILLAFAVAFPGLIAYAINPNLEDPNTAYPYLVTTLMPPALRGMILAALVSAIMSTISSLVNSTATVFTLDIVERFSSKAIAQERLITVGRYTGIGVMAIGLTCVPLVRMWEHIFAYCQEVWVLLAGPTVAVFITGVFWRGAKAQAATLTMALSFPLMAVPFLQKAVPFLPGPIENIFVFGVVVFVACLVVMIAASLFVSQPIGRKAERLVWRWNMLRLPAALSPAGGRWYGRIGFWWLVMIAAYAFIYVTLW